MSNIKNYKKSSLEYLIKIYEVSKDWERAIDLIKTIGDIKVNSHDKESLLAQYYCEISSIYMHQNQIEKSIAITKKALKMNPMCIRANIQLADCYSTNDIGTSCQYLNAIIDQDNSFSSLIINKIISLAKKINNTSVIMKSIMSVSQLKDLAFLPEVYLFLYYEDEKILAQQYIDKFKGDNLINKFIIAHTLISSSENTMAPNIKNLVSSYNEIFSNKHFFVCNNCGYKSNELNWLCPSCNSWETIYPKSAIDLLREGGASESK